MNTFLSTIKKKKVWIPLAIIVVIILVISVYSATKKTDYKTAKVEKRDFVQEVSVTGKVVAANDVDLAFQTGGKVTSIPTSVGAKVTKGQTLAYVGSADLYATLLSRQAALDAERARLAELERGARPEDRAVSQTAFDQAKNSLEAAINDAYIKSDDAVQSKTDLLFTDPRGSNAKFINANDYNLTTSIQNQRLSLGGMLETWRTSVSTLQQTGYTEASLSEAKTNLYKVRDYLNDVSTGVSKVKPTEANISQTTLDGYKSSVSAARSEVSAAISALNGAEQTYRTSQAQLNLKNAGSSSEDIAVEEAAVRGAEANVAQIQAQLANTVISAPFTGTVTKLNLKVGQLVSPSAPVVSMISDAKFEIESFVPEADIAKIKVGDMGTTTLDAYGDKVTFQVVVSAIDLSETTVEGVATYKTTLQFADFDDRIRSGMTTNVDIVSGVHSGVLSVAQSSLVTQSNIKNVLIMNAQGKTQTREVKTGMIDSSGNIEITSGLSEGDIVVTNPPKK